MNAVDPSLRDRLNAAEPERGREADGPGREPLPLLDLAAMAESVPPVRQWAVEGFIPKNEVTLFTGPGSAGKSLLGKQISVCIAAGLPLLDVQAMQGPSLYITCEDDGDELHRRLSKIHCALGVNMSDMVGKLHISCLRGRLGNELCTFDHNGSLKPSPTFHLLRDLITSAGAEFVVLDNVAHLFPGNENDRGEVTAFCNLLNNLAMEAGCTILLIAHPNKAGDSYSGSTAWLNAVRSQITLETPKDSDGTIADPDARVLTVGKANYARNGTKLSFRWHDWAFISESDIPPDQWERMSKSIEGNHRNEVFLKCLAAATKQGRNISHSGARNYFGTVFPRMPEANGMKKPAFESAFESLLNMGEIELDQPLWQGADRHWKKGIKRAGNPAGLARDLGAGNDG